jgi:hypothetical protein
LKVGHKIFHSRPLSICISEGWNVVCNVFSSFLRSWLPI